MPFAELLVGPTLVPKVKLCLSPESIEVNGHRLDISSCFIRHDVFLPQGQIKHPSQVALNWFYAVKGWCLANEHIRIFNRGSKGSENNKIQNLELAARVGIKVPQTVITNDLGRVDQIVQAVLKPPAGGEYTIPLRADVDLDRGLADFPRLVQQRLSKPEYRLYRIGDEAFSFEVQSSRIDYREDPNASIQQAKVPRNTTDAFMQLCDRLSLDFAAADFMTDKHGEICFLEINTQPMFAAFDDVLQGQLCDAIIDYLCAIED